MGSAKRSTETPRGASAWSRFVRAVRADHAMVRHYDAKYGSHERRGESLPKDLVERIGFQMMAALRLTRLCADAGVPLAPKVLARLTRVLYGADIHWDARFDDGVVIVHGMGLAISHAAHIGSGSILSQNVTIGDGFDPVTRAAGAPTIEENVHIGPGATLIGPITVGAGSKIMPGVVLTRSVPPGSLVEAPAPTIAPRAKHAAAPAPKISGGGEAGVS
jgi:serine acetyltransferase